MSFAAATVLMLQERLAQRRDQIGPALDRFVEAAKAGGDLLEAAREPADLVAGIADDLTALVNLRHANDRVGQA